MKGLYRLGVIVDLIERVSGPAKRAIGAIVNLEKTAARAAAVAALAGSLGMAGMAASQAAESWRGAVFDMMQPMVAVEDSMAAMKTVTTSTMGGMQKSLEATRAAAISWSKAHSDSADQYLRTSYQMASAGLNDIQAIEGTKVALTVARATMADSAETANTLAILYNNLGDKTADVGKEMTRLGDVLAKTQAMYQIANLGQLTEGLKYGTPAAVAFGASVEELNVVLGALNSAGLQGGMAGTAYSAAMRQMIKASKELGFEIQKDAKGGVSFVATLEAMRQQFGDASTWSDELRERMQQAFGDEGLRAVTLLVGKTGDLTRAWKDVAAASGTAAEGQRAFEEAPSGKLAILQNNLSALKMEVTNGLLPTLNEVVPKLQEVMAGISRWVEQNPGLAKTAMLVLMAGAAILTVVAPIMMATSAFMSMTAGGLQAAAWLGRAVFSLGGAVGKAGDLIESMQIRWLYAQDGIKAGWGKVVSGTRSAVSAMGNAASAVGRVARSAGTSAVAGLKAMGTGLWQMGVQATRTAITALPGLISATWSFTAALLANPITWIVLAIIALVAAVVLLWKNWDKVSAFLANTWDKIKGAFAAGMDFIKGILGRIGDFFREHIDIILAVVFPFVGIPLLIIKHWDTIAAWFGNLWTNIKAAAVAGLSAVGDWVMGHLRGLVNWFTGLKDTFLDAGRGLWDAFVNGLKAVINKPVELVKGVVQKIRDLLPGSDAKEGPLSSLTSSGKALVTTFGGAMKHELPVLRADLAAGLEDTLSVTSVATDASDGPDFGDGWTPPPPGAPPGRGGSTRPITIQRLIIQVPKLDSAGDLFNELRKLADEIDFDPGDGEVEPA